LAARPGAMIRNEGKNLIGGACPFAPQSVIFCLQRIAAAKE
jgi:hypothetical protein